MIKYNIDKSELNLKEEPQKCMVLSVYGWAYSDEDKEIDIALDVDLPYRVERYNRQDVENCFNDIKSSYCGFTVEVVLHGSCKSIPLVICEGNDNQNNVVLDIYDNKIVSQKRKLQISSLKHKNLQECFAAGKSIMNYQYVIMGSIQGKAYYNIDEILYVNGLKEAVLRGWQVATVGTNTFCFDSGVIKAYELTDRQDVKEIFAIDDKSIKNGFDYRVDIGDKDEVTICFSNDEAGNVKLVLPIAAINGSTVDPSYQLSRETIKEYEEKYGQENVEFKKKEKETYFRESIMNTRPYVAQSNSYQGNTDSCNISVVVAINSKTYLDKIIEKFQSLDYNGVQLVLVGKGNILIDKAEKAEDVVFVEDISDNKEELVVKGYNCATNRYVLFMDQEDDFDDELLPYLTDTFAQGYEYIYSDYDLMYSGNKIVRVNRIQDFLEKENVPYSLVACAFDKNYVGNVDNYAELIDKLKKSNNFTHSDKIYYHYNAVEDSWGNDPTKPIAFYLTQYHETEENNKWWGEGFTEWMNVKRGYPMFEGHDQPRIPTGQGYYDLVEDKMAQYNQVELAKKYGVFGFCYYYYWFEGKRLLRKPLDHFVENHELDLPYCICWANETWSKRWDGKEHEILMQQVHNEQTDRDFIYDIIPMLKDERYIKIKGKPMLLIYRFELFPSPNKTIKLWREICRKEGVGEIHIAIVQAFEAVDHRIYGADSSVEFPPHKVNAIPNIMINDELENVNEDFEGRVYSYKRIVENLSTIERREYNLYPGSMLKWDNTARRLTTSNVFHEFTPELYRRWLIKNHHYTRMYNEENIMFINAWNEWAEGSYLEPDETYGDELLRVTSEVTKCK